MAADVAAFGDSAGGGGLSARLRSCAASPVTGTSLAKKPNFQSSGATTAFQSSGATNLSNATNFVMEGGGRPERSFGNSLLGRSPAQSPVRRRPLSAGQHLTNEAAFLSATQRRRPASSVPRNQSALSADASPGTCTRGILQGAASAGGLQTLQATHDSFGQAGSNLRSHSWGEASRRFPGLTGGESLLDLEARTFWRSVMF